MESKLAEKPKNFYKIWSGKRLIYQQFADPSESPKDILAWLKCRAKTCGKQLPKNCRIEMFYPSHSSPQPSQGPLSPGFSKGYTGFLGFQF